MIEDSRCKLCDNERWDDVPLCVSCCIDIAGFVDGKKREALAQAVGDVPHYNDDFPVQVYYLRFGDRVKIGASYAPAKRVMSLGFDPANIVATEAGGFAREAERHRQFAHLRIEGEWFAVADELVTHIAGLMTLASIPLSVA